MLTGIAFLLGATLLGTGLVHASISLRRFLSFAEQILWGLVIGWLLTTLAIYCVARIEGRLHYGPVLVLTIFEWILALSLWFKLLRHVNLKENNLRTLWRRDYVGIVVLFTVFGLIYLHLFSTHMLAPAAGGIYSGGSTWYDMSFHAALTSSFIYGQNFPPLYTLLPPDQLRYPFLPDFQTAVLMSAGLSMRAALLSTSICLALATTGLMYSLAYRLVRSHYAAVVATTLFLLNGGLGFIYFLRDWWTSGKTLVEFWDSLAVNYANYSELGIHWTNIVADTFLPQRTSLFGLSLALIIFTVFAILWRCWHEVTPEKVESTRSYWILLFSVGVLTGLLPIIHVHTYIAVGLVSIFLFLFRPRWEWLAFWLPAILFALPYLLPLGQSGMANGIVRFLPGWLGHNEPFFPLYLLRNFGVPLLLAVPAWLALSRAWRKFYLAFLLVAVFSFLVVVSPNTFDNGKLTYYWHAVNSIIVASWLVRLATVYQQRFIAAVLILLSVASGVLALQSENHKWQRLFTDEDLAAGDYVRQNTAPRALFLAAPSFNNPITCLAGRSVTRGPTSWLWSHGYEFRDREADVRRIYAGTTDALELLRYYAVDYIYLGYAERIDLKADTLFFDKNFAVAYRSPNITIYDAHNLITKSKTTAGSLNEPGPRELSSRVQLDPFALIKEFDRTSFFVYRLAKASYGRMPSREEFMPAMTELGRGLLIGTPGWEGQLENNRTSLLNIWMKSEDFSKLYDGKTNAEFTNQLLKNSGVKWSQSKYDDLLTSLDSQTASRQLALLMVAEDREFYEREYNTAYVLVHFFGYLRRNPSDPPDQDLRGLNFWLDVLNRSGDYRSISRAFLESDEYKTSKPVQ